MWLISHNRVSNPRLCARLAAPSEDVAAEAKTAGHLVLCLVQAVSPQARGIGNRSSSFPGRYRDVL
eukprot:2099546-Alexandrium_andersonii.AAC.1